MLSNCWSPVSKTSDTVDLNCEQETFGYPLMRPDLKMASRIFCASNFSSDWIEFAPSALRSFNACSNARGTPSGRLLALNATAATIYHGFLRTTRILQKTINLCLMVNTNPQMPSQWPGPQQGFLGIRISCCWGSLMLYEGWKSCWSVEVVSWHSVVSNQSYKSQLYGNRDCQASKGKALTNMSRITDAGFVDVWKYI